MVKKYAYPIAFGMLWLAAGLFYAGLYVFGGAATVSCIAVTIWKASRDTEGGF